ncbi:MAG: glycerophosphoryl diester phosphodiesterase membrane domain-containing protein [Anaeromyxobacter sp.]
MGPGDPRAPLGPLIRPALGIWLRNLHRFGVMGAVAQLPLLGFLAWFFTVLGQEDGGPSGTSALIMFLATGAVGLLVGALGLVAVTAGAAAALRGERLPLRRALGPAWRRVLPVMAGCAVGGAVVAGIALIIALAANGNLQWSSWPPLLAIAGAAAAPVLAVRWWLALPLIALEGEGILSSLRRSAQLTRGRRWALLGALAVQALLALLALGAVVIAGVLVVGALSAPRASGEVVFAFFGVILPATGAAGAAGPVSAAVVYHRLKAAPDAAAQVELAAVFE